jgi:N-acetylmuramoyl-L-alanine amidase
MRIRQQGSNCVKYKFGRILAGILVVGVALAAAPARAVAVRGLALNDVMASHGFGAPSEYGRSAVYRSRSSTVVFEAGSRRVVVDGMSIYLNRAVEKVGRVWAVTPVDAVDTLGAVFYPMRALKAMRGVTVVIDAGHGGSDPGAKAANGVVEKKLTLDVAKRVRARLRDSGVNVFMTRDGDSAVTLDERCWKMAKLGADVFVSIHFNASRNQSTAGVETYVIPAAGCPTTAEEERRMVRGRTVDCPGNRFDAANVVLAGFIHKGVVAHSGAEDRGIRRARFFVIRNATCPAVLVECGFLSNSREAGRIMDEAFRDRLAEGVSRGVLTYLSRVRELHLPPVFR